MRILLIAFISLSSCAVHDWRGVEVPVSEIKKNQWKLDKKISDSFNYKGKGSTFYKKWKDSYVNNWKGPGLSHFSPNHSLIENGKLHIKASKKSPNKVYCGVVSSKKPLIYPVYMEISMKISGLKLSSNFWFISADQVNEIDVNETYGNDFQRGKTMGTNYHIFQRSPFKDLVPGNGKHVKAVTGEMLKDNYHRFGCYWKNAFTAYFYLDGKLIREMKMKDPRTPSNGFDQPMFMIIDTEDHEWRSKKGIVASDEELQDKTINTMYVDWVRVYNLR